MLQPNITLFCFLTVVPTYITSEFQEFQMYLTKRFKFGGIVPTFVDINFVNFTSGYIEEPLPPLAQRFLCSLSGG